MAGPDPLKMIYISLRHHYDYQADQKQRAGGADNPRKKDEKKPEIFMCTVFYVVAVAKRNTGKKHGECPRRKTEKCHISPCVSYHGVGIDGLF